MSPRELHESNPRDRIAGAARSRPHATSRVYTDDDRMHEVARIRARDVDRAVAERVYANPHCSKADVEQWVIEEYRRWREKWPALNSLLIPNGTEEA